MKKFDLSYNYYYPFYTMDKAGVKKYYYIEKVYMHLSRDTELMFEFEYREKKLNKIVFKKITNGKITPYSKKTTHISYVEFAKRINTFQSFLNKGLRSLKQSVPYLKREIIFLKAYKFNTEFELTFDYSNIELSKDIFNHQIIDGKKISQISPIKGVAESETLNKLNIFLESAERTNNSYQPMSEDRFNEELDSVLERIQPYMLAPKKLFKKEYKI